LGIRRLPTHPFSASSNSASLPRERSELKTDLAPPKGGAKKVSGQSQFCRLGESDINGSANNGSTEIVETSRTINLTHPNDPEREQWEEGIVATQNLMVKKKKRRRRERKPRWKTTFEDYFYAKTKRAAIRLFRLRVNAGY
jgi:hypothetical protein